VREFIVIPAKPDSVDDFLRSISELIDKKEAFKVKVTGMSNRSLSQSALLHIWVREYAAWRFKVPLKSIQKSDVDDAKIILKQAAYNNADYRWLCKRVTNHDTGISALVLKSTSEYDKGEMFMFMEFVQAFAAQQGVALETLGEFGRLKDETNV